MPEERKITQLLANQPIELTEETDFFNTIPKAETILSFIETFSASLEKNKLLALYGDWGSGKTSLIRYLEKKLEQPKSSFRTIYFETWKYEKDDNLALSLVDVIIEKVDKRHKQVIQNFKSISFSLMKNFAKSISFQIPGINIDTNTFLSGIEKDIVTKNDSLSFHQKLEAFESSFKEIENQIAKKDNKRIIIFIDDLDRCEPENILNLLTALKHFFAHGEKTIFFCGIDKDAVTKAVKHKYHDVVKSEEYLEKIFDISFNMPKKFYILKILEYYFKDKYYDASFYKLLNDFFTSTDFTNPRHMKKVLNKYLIVRYIKNKKLTNHELIPEISSEYPFNIILVLYFIILFEFYNEIFYDLENIENRTNYFIDEFYKYEVEYRSMARNKQSYSLREAQVDLERFLPDGNETIQGFFNSKNNLILKYLNIFLPKPENAFDKDTETSSIKKLRNYIEQFAINEQKIQTGFCNFLITKQNELKTDILHPEYKIWTLFKMAKTIL